MNHLFSKLSIASFAILLTVFGDANAQSNYTISGNVRDGNNGEDLIGVSIIDDASGVGATTNVYGFYSLTVPAGQHTFIFSYIGFDPDTLKVDLQANLTHTTELKTGSVSVQEVVVKAERKNENVTSTDIGVVKMDIKEMNAIPVLFGEKDVMKSIQLMPGIASAGEGNSGFFVRGGNVDQNLILLDEAPVYNPSHLLGFFSVFNSDAIKDMTMYKSGVPAEYGGRSASVMDVHMNDGNMKRYGFSGGIGLISARLAVQGPIVKDKGSFIISGRRTYLDLFIPLIQPESKGTQLYFYDLNAKVNYKIGKKDRLYLSGYFGRDVLKFNDFGFDWGNATATLRWNHVFNEKLFSNTSFIFSNYDYSIGIGLGTSNFDISAGIQDLNLKEDLTYYHNPKNTMRFGFNVIYHNYSPGKLVSEGENAFNAVILDNAYATESAIYAANEQKIWRGLSARYGLRISMFNRLGSATIFDYDDNNAITDTTTYGRAENIKTYFGVEPRLSLTYAFSQSISVKASYHRMYQYNHLLSNSTAGTPTDVWIPSSPILKPQFSDQYSLGYFQNFFNDQFEFSIEGYYKDMANVVDYENGADLLLNAKVESQLAFGSGRSYGGELLFRRKTGKITGWVSYTLSKTEKKVAGVNNGNYYNATQDRTHDVSIVLSYKPIERLSISANWVFYTGNAVTFPSGVYAVDGELVPYYTERNGYRMPDYHRLDMSVTLHGKKRKRFNSDLTLSIYNVYAQKNPYSISFRESEDNPGKTEIVKLSLFTIVPSITWNFKFN
ncbi:MAG: TonB-dependent receptor [Flavobacteriales bacterium]